MKKIFFAFMCIGALLMTACNQPNKPEQNEGEWYTAASQIDVASFDSQKEKCWALDLWCDGTTIGRQHEWCSEAEIAATAKMILTMDYQTFGRQTKKVKWSEAKANDEDACHALVWEGAACWEETISYGDQSETGYGWMPEANMRERHDYYQGKGLTHTYKPADAADEAACEALNDED